MWEDCLRAVRLVATDPVPVAYGNRFDEAVGVAPSWRWALRRNDILCNAVAGGGESAAAGASQC